MAVSLWGVPLLQLNTVYFLVIAHLQFWVPVSKMRTQSLEISNARMDHLQSPEEFDLQTNQSDLLESSLLPLTYLAMHWDSDWQRKLDWVTTVFFPLLHTSCFVSMSVTTIRRPCFCPMPFLLHSHSMTSVKRTSSFHENSLSTRTRSWVRRKRVIWNVSKDAATLVNSLHDTNNPTYCR